jgi:Pentapeptide repeats (9 copies)
VSTKFTLLTLSLFLCFNIYIKAQDTIRLDKNIVDEPIRFDERRIQQVLRKHNDKLNYFTSTFIKKPASFKSATFVQMVYFDSVAFNNTTNFFNATFNEDIELINALFRDYSDFTGVIFLKTADFTGAKFDQQVDFSGSNFGSSVDFSDVIFKNKISFKNLVLSPETQILFSNTVLPDTLDFSYNNSSSLDNEIDLTTANFTDSGQNIDKPHLIQFMKTEISKFHLDYYHFRLLIPDSIQSPDNSKMRIAISNDEKESIFEGLLNNFKVHGQNESYRKLDIEYKRFQFYRNWWTVPFYWISLLWWNFGYNKELIFLWTIFFALLFTSLNYFKLEKLNTSTYPIDYLPKDYSKMTISRKYWYSFVYTSIIFFRLTLNVDKLSFNNIRGTIYILMIYALGLLCLAYMANFIIQK